MNNNGNIKNSYLFLILIIASNILLTLPLINRPLYSLYDSARQIHTAVITKDLYENNGNIFNTKTYLAGQKAIYIEEFPIYNLIVVLGYKIFGPHEIIGRIVSLLLFQIALLVLYKLLRIYSDMKTSILAVFIFSFSYYPLYYNDFFQQTTTDILLLLLHLYFFSKFILKDSTANYTLWLIFGTLNFIERPIFLVLLLPIAITLLNKYGWSFFFKARIIIFFSSAFIFTAGWYLYGYLMTGNEISGFYDGYFTPLKIFKKNTHYYITKFISYTFNSLIRNFTIPFAILYFLGIIFYAFKKQYRFISLWMLSMIILQFLIPSKVIVHRHYLVPLFLSMPLFIALPLNEILKKLKTIKIRYAEIYLFSLVAFFYLASIYPDTIRQKSLIKIYVEPISTRVSSKSKPDENIVFISDHIQNVWSNSLLYASDRCGLMLNLDSDLPRAITINKSENQISKIAVLKVDNNIDDCIVKPPECCNLAWLLCKYRLIENFQDAYFLLDARIENKYLMNKKEYQPINLNFSNGSKLSGIEISEIYVKNNCRYADIIFIWETNHYFKENRDLFMVSVDQGKMNAIFTHKLFGEVFPTSKWRPDKFFAETISIPLKDKTFYKNPLLLSFVLFDPQNCTVLKPSTTNHSNPTIVLDINIQRAWIQDYSKDKLLIDNKKITLKKHSNDKFRKMIFKNYLCYINIKNIEETLEFESLGLQDYYQYKRLN